MNIVDIVKRAVNTEFASGIRGEQRTEIKHTTTQSTKKNTAVLYPAIEPAASKKKTNILEETQSKSQAELKAQQDYLAIMSNTMTAEDFQKVQEEGYSINDTEVEHIVTVVDKIRIRLAASGNTSVNLDGMDAEEIEAVTKSAGIAVKLAKQFKENNLPVTEENLKSAMQAYEEGMEITPLSENSMKYMIENELEPTIDNIYKAEFSSPDIKNQREFTYYAQDTSGYYAKKATDINWDNIEGQMKEVIASSGLEQNAFQMGNAKWLVENDIPLTVDNLLQMNELRNIVLPKDEDSLVQNIVTGMTDGREAKDALLSDQKTRYERAAQAVDCIQNVTTEEVRAVVDTGREVTIEELEKQKGQSYHGAVEESDYRVIAARRQLEELRLLMTSEAAAKMIKQGINVETESLVSLVEELKTMEQESYQKLFQQNQVEMTQENVAQFKDTTAKVNALADMPAYALGSRQVLAEFTINAVYEEGETQKSRYQSAGQAYETMMTKPRSDLGDSMKKALRNVDNLLDSLHMEKTSYNQRAVRILAYNRMEITTDSIEQVKQADMAVNRLMKTMTPQATLSMIREGRNPLDTNIYDLNEELSQTSTQFEDTKDEKYSEFLWKLQKNDQITQEERDAYVNVYRLFYQIEKSEDSVVGALLNQGADITMRNLIIGTRNARAKHMDVTINDQTGSVEATSTATLDMIHAMETGFSGNDKQAGNNEQRKEQSYYEGLVRDALEHMSPEKMRSLPVNTMTLESFADAMVNGQEDMEQNLAYQQEQISLVQEASQAEDSFIKMLLKYDQPVTVNNILSAGVLLNQRGSVFRELMTKAASIPGGKDRTKKLSASFDRITDRLISKEAAQSAYEDMVSQAEDVLEETDFLNGGEAVDIRSLKALHKQLQLCGSLSKEENYEIPMYIQSELTSVNVKIIHNASEKGTTVITMATQTYGKVAARFTVDKERIAGLIVAEEPQFLEKAKAQDVALRSSLNTAEQTVRKMNYAIGTDVDLNQFEDNLERSKEDGVSTQALYQISKKFLHFIKSLG